MTVKADAYLPVIVKNLPVRFVFQPDGKLRDKVARSCAMGVTRVIAGAEMVHLIIDVKRPYWRSLPHTDFSRARHQIKEAY